MTLSRTITPELARARLVALCNRSEQCSHDVRLKLKTWGVAANQAEAIMAGLVESRLVDDRRFACLFARHKLIYNGWGRRKIFAGLTAKRIDRSLIDEALNSLDPVEYRETMLKVMRTTARRQPDQSYESKMKILRHGASRGFEAAAMVEIIKSGTLWDNSEET